MTSGITEGAGADRRSSGRVEMTCGCTLSRGSGAAVVAQTIDIGSGGMRVVTTRPLRVDEALRFELTAVGMLPVSGRARVMREHARGVYAMSFERLADTVHQRLLELVAGTTRDGPAYSPRDT